MSWKPVGVNLRTSPTFSVSVVGLKAKPEVVIVLAGVSPAHETKTMFALLPVADDDATDELEDDAEVDEDDELDADVVEPLVDEVVEPVVAADDDFDELVVVDADVVDVAPPPWPPAPPVPLESPQPNEESTAASAAPTSREFFMPRGMRRLRR
jgi:hypothetical protein